LTDERLIEGLTALWEYLHEDGHSKVALWAISAAIDRIKTLPGATTSEAEKEVVDGDPT
jgi:hypothetical protein